MLQNNKLVRKLDVSKYLLLVLTVFICTFFLYKDFDIRMLYGYGVLAILVAIQCINCLCQKNMPKVSLIEAVFMVIVLTVVISSCRPDANWNVDLLLYVIAMLISAAYLLLTNPDRAQLRYVIKVVAISSLLFALFVLACTVCENLFYKGYYPLLSEASKEYADRYIPRGYSPVLGGSCTYTDYIMMMGIGVFSGGLFSRKNDQKSKKLLCLLAVGVLTIAIAVVGRRGELLGIAAVLVVIWILLAKDKKHRWIRAVSLVGAALVALGLFILLLPKLKEIDFLRRYVMTIEKLLAGQDITSGRTELYSQALKLFAANPIFGIGWGQFANYITPEFKAVHGQDVADVHNIYLSFLCEVGIVGAIFIIVPMVYMLVQTIKQFNRLSNAPVDSPDKKLTIQLNTVSLTIQLFFLLVGMLDICFSKVIFWAMYALAAKLLSCSIALEGFEINDVFTRTWNRILKRLVSLTKKR